MNHFLNTQDWSFEGLQHLLAKASDFKANKLGNQLQGKSIALLFFNPSLRTRTSFELGAFQMGAHAVVLQPGKDAWPIEFELGTRMDGDTEEHIIEVAKVLSSYVDLIAVRAFPKFIDWQDDRKDKVLKAFAKYATVPVINMETITHPCQEMAHILALQEHFGTRDLRGKKFVLTWTYHPKALNTAVANSALTIATRMGMDVTLLCPNEHYVLDARYMGWAQQNAEAMGSSMQVSHDIQSTYADADVVYAKSWGALPYFGNWTEEKPMRDSNQHFIVDETKMALTNNAVFSHCLPLRRNIKATDAVMDSAHCIAIQEAENRLHVQKAIMDCLINHPEIN
ncbi:MAG: N-acetylornithine carbamoyltransferase [Arenimonas sp.]|nr:N-acetylornithine carbamoyltransferase [Arenimonas sp.]MBP6309344.1 N-acetylornithine carbamoyltransferase [Arenimonas sp.]